MSTDLFSEPLRQALWARGWKQTGGAHRGVLLWRRPDGTLLTEEEAFTQVEAILNQERGATSDDKSEGTSGSGGEGGAPAPPQGAD